MSWQRSYDLLANLLANSSGMQTLLGVSNATDAAARIYQDVEPPPPGGGTTYTKADFVALRPYVMLSSEDGFSKYRVRRTGTGCWKATGSMWASVMRNIPDDETPAQAQQSFRTAIGDVILPELEILRDDPAGGYLAYEAVEVEGPWRVHKDELQSHGDHDWVILKFLWGPDIAQG